MEEWERRQSSTRAASPGSAPNIWRKVTEAGKGTRKRGLIETEVRIAFDQRIEVAKNRHGGSRGITTEGIERAEEETKKDIIKKR